MSFEVGFFVMAVVASLGVGVLLYRWQRPKLTLPYLLLAVAGSIFALYYILHVVFGSGRTGWP
ncbi:hypothetical protein [Pseudodesulfovibrio portus]|jgi:hypothetical protein|uniref:PEP-CTERM protein-sorting domain-containing protein n=1 Tax=Pseudodesulfovibrio portus TaxID=231439 RepID=A0ABN6RWW9_9BACT|nr:hypothetical protein [Pseudodesulfovibrio portus]BDQ35544.1 hypothetical protein JCM14722_30860 [Pseudodesulfovibrio portus]